MPLDRRAELDDVDALRPEQISSLQAAPEVLRQAFLLRAEAAQIDDPADAGHPCRGSEVRRCLAVEGGEAGPGSQGVDQVVGRVDAGQRGRK